MIQHIIQEMLQMPRRLLQLPLMLRSRTRNNFSGNARLQGEGIAEWLQRLIEIDAPSDIRADVQAILQAKGNFLVLLSSLDRFSKHIQKLGFIYTSSADAIRYS